MAKHFKTIGLIGRYRDSGEGVLTTLHTLENYLVNNGYQIILDDEAARELESPQFPSVPTQELGQHCDLIIVVGGDGSLLNAARGAAANDTPVLGVNRGRLGFLTDIHPDDVEQGVAAVLAGQYIEEKRFLLQASLKIDQQVRHLDPALNDIALTPGEIPHLIEFQVSINQQHMCTQRADGIIVTTPTGSTAYALSGGGPILHPKLDAIALVPMFPHTLSSRPIVVDGSSQIEIQITENTECSPQVSCDGHERITVAPGGKIIIKKQEKLLRLIHPNNYNYFETLRTKLGWERYH